MVIIHRIQSAKNVTFGFVLKTLSFTGNLLSKTHFYFLMGNLICDGYTLEW